MVAVKTHWTRTSGNKYSNSAYAADPAVLGNAFYVCSASGSAADNATSGLTPEQPFATLAYAMSAATASNHDEILLLPGHAETYSVTGPSVTFKAGVKVRGLGIGADRPTFTFSHTGAQFVFSGASATLENVILTPGVNSVVAPISVSAAGCVFKKVEWVEGSSLEFLTGLVTTTAGNDLTVDECFYNGQTGAAANLTCLKLVGVERGLIRNCRFEGKPSTAAIQFITTACTQIVIDSCEFLVTSTVDQSKNVVDTQGSSQWIAYKCFDAASGGAYQGSSLSGGAQQLPRITKFTKADVTAATAWTTGNSPITIFTVTGDVLVKCWGVVTTILTSTGGTGTLSLGTPDAVTALIGTTSVNGTILHTVKYIWASTAGAATIYALPGTDSWYAVSGTNIVLTVATNSMTAGGMNIYCQWIPISAGASVV